MAGLSDKAQGAVRRVDGRRAPEDALVAPTRGASTRGAVGAAIVVVVALVGVVGYRC